MFTISNKNIHFHCDKEINEKYFFIIDEFYKKIIKIPLILIKGIDFYVNFEETPMFWSYRISFDNTYHETTVFKDGKFIIESHNLNMSDYDYYNKTCESTFFRHAFLNIIKEME